jgi:hypothetical protein
MGWPSPFVDEGVLRRSGSQHSSVQGPGRLQHAQSAIVGGTRRFFERQSPLTGPSVNGLSVRREHSEHRKDKEDPKTCSKATFSCRVVAAKGQIRPLDPSVVRAWSEPDSVALLRRSATARAAKRSPLLHLQEHSAARRTGLVHCAGGQGSGPARSRGAPARLAGCRRGSDRKSHLSPKDQ